MTNKATARPGAAARPAGPPDRPRLDVRPILPPFEQVAAELEALFVAGRLGPGDRLPAEAQLAADFGVSRNTVRQALRALSARRVIYSVRGVNGGTFVAGSDMAAVSSYLETSLSLLSTNQEMTAGELLEARDLLEVPAARLAAERRTPDQLHSLTRALEVELAVPRRQRQAGVDNAFHNLLLDAAANRMIILMTVPIFRVIETRFAAERQPERLWKLIDDDHELILDCVARQDGVAAAAAMHAHLGHLRPAYTRIDRVQPAKTTG